MLDQERFDIYIDSLSAELPEPLGALEQEALAAGVPIIRKATQSLLAFGTVFLYFSGDRFVYGLCDSGDQPSLHAEDLSGKYLEQNGVKALDTTTGTEFDTEFHEAVTLFPAADDSQKGKVIDTVQKGYKLHDKVLRHAKVVVGQ